MTCYYNDKISQVTSDQYHDVDNFDWDQYMDHGIIHVTYNQSMRLVTIIMTLFMQMATFQQMEFVFR
jgi:hypothetical protein